MSRLKKCAHHFPCDCANEKAGGEVEGPSRIAPPQESEQASYEKRPIPPAVHLTEFSSNIFKL